MAENEATKKVRDPTLVAENLIRMKVSIDMDIKLAKGDEVNHQ